MAISIRYGIGTVDSNWNVIVSENTSHDEVFIQINRFAAFKARCTPAEWKTLVAYCESYTDRVKFEQLRWGGTEMSEFLEGAPDAKTTRIMIRPFHEVQDQYLVELETGKLGLVDKEGIFFLLRVMGEGCKFYKDDYFKTKTTNADGSVLIIDMGDTDDTTPLVDTSPIIVEFAKDAASYHDIVHNYVNNRFLTIEATLQCYNDKYAYTVQYNKAIEAAMTEYQKKKLEETNKLINARVEALKKRRENLIKIADSGIDTTSASINSQLVTMDAEIETAYQTAIADATGSTTGLLAQFTEGIEKPSGSDKEGTKSMRLSFFNEAFFDIGSGVDFDIFTGYMKMVIDKWIDLKINYEYTYDNAVGGHHENMAANNPMKFYRYFDTSSEYSEPLMREMFFVPYAGYAYRISEGWNFKGIVWLLNKLNISYYVYDIEFNSNTPTGMEYHRLLTEPVQFSNDDIIHIYKNEQGDKYVQRGDAPGNYVSLAQIKDIYKIDLYSFMKSFGIPYEEMDDLIKIDEIGQPPENWAPQEPVTVVDKNALITEAESK